MPVFDQRAVAVEEDRLWGGSSRASLWLPALLLLLLLTIGFLVGTLALFYQVINNECHFISVCCICRHNV